MLPKPVGRLLIIDKEGENYVDFILDNERVLLGRSTECNITINSRAVSRFSAVFEYNQDTNSTWITSLGSNLITVDKKDLANDQPMELQPGSLIEVQVADHTRTFVYQLMDEPMVMPECCEGLLEHTLQLPAIEQPVAGADENAAPAVPPPPPVMPPLAKASSGGAMALIHAEELQRLRQGLRPVVPASPKVAASPARTAVKRKSVRFTASANATPEGVCDATMVLTAHTGSSPAVDVMADSTMAFAQWAMGTHVAEITPGSTHRQSVQRRTSTPAATRAVVGTPRTSAKSSAAQRTPAARTPSAATPNTMPMASAGGTAARSTRGKSRLANASVGGLSSAVDDTMQATLDVAMMAAARMFTVVDNAEQTGQLNVADMQAVQDMVQKAVEAALQAHAEFHDEQPAAGTGAPVDVIDDPPQHAHPAPHEPCVADASRDAPHQCSDDILHETAHEEASQDEALVDMEEAIDVEAAQAMEDEAEETLNTCTMALSDAWDLHFAHGHAPSDVETAAKVARDVCDQASKVIRAGLAYRAQTGMLKKRLLRLTKANHALREQNKRLQLELMAANALLQAADLDDAAGSDYKPSPQPASETWATDEEVPSEPAHTPHSASQLAIIRQGRPIGASPASVAPRAGDATTSTQFRDTPTRRPVAATQLPLSNVEGWPSGVGAPPMSVTRSCTKGFVPVGATPVRRRSLLAPHVHEGLQASVAKCGLAPAAGYHATPSSEADLDDRVVAACNNDLNAGSSGLVVEESDTECDAGDGPEGELDEGIGHGQSRRGTRASARVTRAKTTESAAVEAPKARSARVAAKAAAKAAAVEEEGPSRKRRGTKAEEQGAAKRTRRGGSVEVAAAVETAPEPVVTAETRAVKAPSRKRQAAKENAPVQQAAAKRTRRGGSADSEPPVLLDATNKAPARRGRKQQAAVEAPARTTRRSTRAQK